MTSNRLTLTPRPLSERYSFPQIIPFSTIVYSKDMVSLIEWHIPITLDQVHDQLTIEVRHADFDHRATFSGVA